MFLNCHSYFSFKYGTLSIPKIIDYAIEKGIKRFALTDINNTSGCLELMREAPKKSLYPTLGIDFRNGNTCLYIGIAKNQQGFAALNRYLSQYLQSGEAFPTKAPSLPDTYFIYPFLSTGHLKKEDLSENMFIGIRYQDLPALRFSHWKNVQQKLLAFQPVTFSHCIHSQEEDPLHYRNPCIPILKTKPKFSKDYNAHRLLRAIDHNTLLSKLAPSECAMPEEVFLSSSEIACYFQEMPELVSKSNALLETCHWQMEFGTSKNRISFYPSREEDIQKLKELTLVGIQFRYGAMNGIIQARMEKELELIIEKNFVSYFLINWDMLCYARQRGFFYVGRGSGANSLVAYCLRITDVDPIELDLYFERFLNLFRENPPDFDIDFSWKDRDEILRYLFEKYGTERTCLLATYSTFQLRSVMRELGKVFGLPKTDIEELIYMYGKAPASHKLGQLVYYYGQYLQDFPSHLSIHAGGVLISEEPIYNYTATSYPPKGFPTSQFSMLEAEDIGLYKFDILSQRGLGHIREAVDIIRENRGIEIDIHRIDEFKKDPAILHLLNTGHTMGCFYVESPAMRMLLSKLGVVDYLGLVAASSIIRPGVAQSGMMRQYILFHRYPEKRTSQHPIMLDIMPETYGVMVYQEDVIKVVHLFAGLSLAEADVLRRGMSGKFRSRDEFARVKEKFFSNCAEKGYAHALSAEIWRQIESFAGYSFAKGHSASFAVESFQSLFLKAHYPLEFMVGVINNFGGFYQTEFYIHEARMAGAKIEAPCMLRSQHFTSIKGTIIYLGFIHIASLEQKIVSRILIDRSSNGSFLSLEDFLFRNPIGLESLVLLIRIGAFRFTGETKQALLWKAHFILNKNTNKAIGQPIAQLFYHRQIKDFKLPPFDYDLREDLLDELDLLGFTLSPTFNLLSEFRIQEVLAIDLPQHLGKVIDMVGQLVTVKPTRTIKGETMYFGTFIDRHGNWIDTVHFPPVAKKFPFRKSGCYHLHGKVVEEFHYFSLEVQSMEKLGYWNREEG